MTFSRLQRKEVAELSSKPKHCGSGIKVLNHTHITPLKKSLICYTYLSNPVIFRVSWVGGGCKGELLKKKVRIKWYILLCSFLKCFSVLVSTTRSVVTQTDTKLSVSEMDLYSESLMSIDKRHGRTQPNQGGLNQTQSSKQLYSLEMLSERLNLWIFILFGRGLGSVNRTDFVQHMLRKNLEAL